MVYHTVIRVQDIKGSVTYIRKEDDEYESANYYENYYTNMNIYPNTYTAVVINQFITEDEDEDEP